MEAMLIALNLIGFKKDAAAVQVEWDALAKSTGTAQTPLYRKACPQHLLRQAADRALEGTTMIGCRIVQENSSDKVHDLLNSAWQKFWTSPNDYAQWERDRIANLKQTSAVI
jgi:hypothetical protein